MFVHKIPDQRFGEALGKRIGIRPAELLRALCARVGQRLPKPARAILANLIFKRRPVQIFRGVFLFLSRARQLLVTSVGFRPRFGIAHQRFERRPLNRCVETWNIFGV